jgi:hypothetical protein
MNLFSNIVLEDGISTSNDVEIDSVIQYFIQLLIRCCMLVVNDFKCN